MRRTRRGDLAVLVGLLAGVAAGACSDGATPGDAAIGGDGLAPRDGVTPAQDAAPADAVGSDGSAANGSGCAAAGGRCESSCGDGFPIDTPEHNDCPQPCPECGACSLFCCLPDPECDATAGCVKVCEGGVCECQCPAQQTDCGEASCDRKTEVCVGKGPIGPSVSYACQPVPAGCETVRACACVATKLCAASDTCADEGDNKIFCDNGSQ